jgi:aarF domain-containing kinase
MYVSHLCSTLLIIGSEAKEYVAKLCKDELGKDFDDIFESWDDVPLGVASIGEVHRAVLKENKQTVAVKVLVPGIEQKFKSDIKTIKMFCQLAMPQHVPAFDEIEKQFLTEFDYTKEAENLDRARNNIIKRWSQNDADNNTSNSKQAPTLSDRVFQWLSVLTNTQNAEIEVVVPKPYTNYCSTHMLVMEYLDGVKLADGVREQYRKLAPLMGKTLEQLEAENKKLIEEGKFSFKDIEEEKKSQQKTRVLLALKDIYNTNGLRFLYNYSPLRALYGPKEYVWTDVPVDLAPILEKLSTVQANNIFFDGEFNGDAHPGNILLLKDGRIGLIDYGQVKKMSVDSRTKYAKLMLAHSRRDEKEVVRLTFDELGTITKYKKPDICYKHSAFWNDRLTEDVMEGKQFRLLYWVET